ncbi:MAG: hypothetical protein EOO06_15900 [Chitinophagaceae bacterium]|nr:MAG: hypothetical protein EOO06_15900 [Chitinophagaceae bacterium]
MSTKFIISLISLSVFSSCYFGAGLVEQRLVGNIHLVAMNSLEEAELICEEGSSSVYHVLVRPAVFAIGYNETFIIAKSHPIALGKIDRTRTAYHIIEVDKISCEVDQTIPKLTFEEFRSKCDKLDVPEDLAFTIDLEKD